MSTGPLVMFVREWQRHGDGCGQHPCRVHRRFIILAVKLAHVVTPLGAFKFLESFVHSRYKFCVP